MVNEDHLINTNITLLATTSMILLPITMSVLANNAIICLTVSIANILLIAIPQFIRCYLNPIKIVISPSPSFTRME